MSTPITNPPDVVNNNPPETQAPAPEATSAQPPKKEYNFFEDLPSFDTVADEFEFLKAAVALARLGYFQSTLLGEDDLVFGDVNTRPLNKQQVRNLLIDFIKHGVQRTDDKCAIKILMSGKLLAEELRTGQPKSVGLFHEHPVFAWSDNGAGLAAGQVFAESGHHRSVARTEALEIVEADIKKELEKDIAQQDDKKLRRLEGLKNRLLVWLTDVIDKGK
jgi:hypothetical protein